MITTVPAADARHSSTITRHHNPGIDTTVVARHGLREVHLTLRPLAGERPVMMLWRLDAALRTNNATVVKHDVFGSLTAAADVLASMKRLFGNLCWPVTWIEGAACVSSGHDAAGAGRNGAIAGMQVMAVSGAAVKTIFADQRPIGRVFEDAWAKHCVLGDVRPTDLSKRNTAQAWQVYQRIEDALQQAGMVLSDVVRTWLFLDNILSWYGLFNTVRTEIFTQRSLFERGVPASTGIGGKNLIGAALVAGAWALQPMDDSTCVREVRSPLQCSARSYGSCFSRAVELKTPGHHRLLISGTASIDPVGRSVREGDAPGQINLTMAVVEAILASRGMGFSDVTRAITYFKRAGDAALFAGWCAVHRTVLPAVSMQAEVCRDELLFEIELDAMASRQARDAKQTDGRESDVVRKSSPEATVAGPHV